MAAVTELASVRLLRPLLDVPKDALQAVCRQFGQPWFEDPSNANDAFERVRVRRSMADVDGFADAAREAAHKRLARERQVSALLAETCRVTPKGYAYVAATKLTGAVAPLAVQRIAACIGGLAYLPAEGKAVRVLDHLRRGKGASLGRCIWRPAAGGQVLVYREARSLPQLVPVRSGQNLYWDGRFRLYVGDVPGSAVLRPGKPIENKVLPHAVRPSMPVLVDGTTGAPLGGLKVSFRPLNPLGPMGFALANGFG